MIQVTKVIVGPSTSMDHMWNFGEAISVKGVECKLLVTEAGGYKCPRCWMHNAPFENDPCNRCRSVLSVVEKPEGENSPAT